jgi:hypothetical protein
MLIAPRTVTRLPLLTARTDEEWTAACAAAYATLAAVVGTDDITPPEYQGGAHEEYRVHGHRTYPLTTHTAYVPIVRTY